MHLRAHKTSKRARARVYAPSARARAQIFTKIFLVVSLCFMNLSIKFRKDLCFRWGDIQLLVTMYIWFYTLNYSQFLTKNFDFFGHLLENVFTYSRHATFHWKNAIYVLGQTKRTRTYHMVLRQVLPGQNGPRHPLVHRIDRWLSGEKLQIRPISANLNGELTELDKF